MMTTWFVVAILLLLLVAFLAYTDTKKPKNFPPGPAWFPIVGCAWRLRRLRKKLGSLPEASHQLSTVYGPLVGLRIGRQMGALVNGFEALRELFTRDEFGRPNDLSATTSETLGKSVGILFNDCELVREQRNFVVKQLERYGFRRRDLANNLESEVRGIIEDVKKKISGGNIIHVENLFGLHVMRNTWTLLSGGRCAPSQEELEEFRIAMADFSKETDGEDDLFDYMPFLIHICPNLCGYNTLVDVHENITALIKARIKVHKKTYDESPHRGFIDEYLHMLSTSDKKKGYSEDRLVAICLDLIIAVFGTTSSIINSAFLYLLLYPDVQRKAQEEIDRVIGKERLPTLEDKARLQYVDCAVLEILRLTIGRSIVIPRRALTDSVLNGYFIPKDTVLLGNFRDVLLSEDAGWENPRDLKPERFMKDGAIVIPENFIPFGMGKRRCIGETFGYSTLFLVVASVLQTFKFEAVPGSHLKPNFVEGFLPNAKEFKAYVTLR